MLHLHTVLVYIVFCSVVPAAAPELSTLPMLLFTAAAYIIP
jgi:hypothetical protein